MSQAKTVEVESFSTSGRAGSSFTGVNCGPVSSRRPVELSRPRMKDNSKRKMVEKHRTLAIFGLRVLQEDVYFDFGEIGILGLR